jgi:hypothetical protein
MTLFAAKRDITFSLRHKMPPRSNASSKSTKGVQGTPYMVCVIESHGGTILKSISGTSPLNMKHNSKIFEDDNVYEIIRAGGEHVRSNLTAVLMNEFDAGSMLYSSAPAMALVSDKMKNVASFSGWEALLFENVPSNTTVYSFDHCREMSSDDYMCSIPVDGYDDGYVFTTVQQQGSALAKPKRKTKDVTTTHSLPVELENAMAATKISNPAPEVKMAAMHIVALNRPACKAFDVRVREILEMTTEAGGPISHSPDRMEATLHVFMCMPVSNLVKLATTAIIACPIAITLTGLVRGVSTLVTVPIDEFHVYYLAFMAYRYGFVGTLKSASGCEIYATAMLNQLMTKVDASPCVMFAFQKCAVSSPWWVPTPQQLRNVIDTFRFYHEPACNFYPQHPMLSTIMKRTEDMIEIGTIVRAHPFATVCALSTFINEREVFFYMNGDCHPTTAAIFTKYVDACQNARAPWDVALWGDMADLSAGKAMYFKDLLRHNSEFWNDVVPAPAVIGIMNMKYDLGPGWIASMISKNALTVNLPGRGSTVLVGCLNFRDLYGMPTIMRDGTTGDSDDLTHDEKEIGAAKLREQFRESGLKFSNVPSAFDFLKDTYLWDINGTPTVRTRRTDPKTGEYKYTTKFVCPGGFLTRMFPMAKLNPIELNESTADCRDRVVNGTGVCENVLQLVEQFFKLIPKIAKYRIIAELRHYDSTIELSGEPYLHAGTRYTFKLLSFMACVCPSIVTRKQLKFSVLEGPLYWELTRKHLVSDVPIHSPWNIYSCGRLVAREEHRILVHSPRFGNVQFTSGDTYNKVANMYSQYCKFEETCTNCTLQPVLRHVCGTVSRCIKCGIPAQCSACNAQSVESDWTPVRLAPVIRLDPTTKTSSVEVRPPLFPWQIESVNKLISFERPAEVVWLPPGSGKTRIIIDYIIWCNDNNCMAKYMLWVTPTAAIANLVLQLAAAGIPIYKHEKRRESLRPNCVNIVQTDALIYLNKDELFAISSELTFVLDEFHSCLGGTSQKSEVARSLARSSLRTIPMSGTVYRNQTSIGDLASFLSLCVDFSVTQSNIQVALGLMISYKVPSKSTIRREIVRVEYDPSRYDSSTGTDNWKHGMFLCDAMVPYILDSVEEEVGVVVGVADISCGTYLHDRLAVLGISSVMQNSANPLSINPTVAPDPRGPGIIARDEYIANGLTPPKQILDVTMAAQVPGTRGAHTRPMRQYACTAEIVNNVVDQFSKGDISALNAATPHLKPVAGQEANHSWRLPHVIIVVVKEGSVAGYDMNRYRRMYVPVVPMATSTRAQFEGRIDRVNNDSPFIEYVSFYTSDQETMQQSQEAARAASDAYRDVQEGSDATRRINEGMQYSAAIDFFNRAFIRRARALGISNPDVDSDPDNDSIDVACEFFGIAIAGAQVIMQKSFERAQREISKHLPREGQDLSSAPGTYIAAHQRFLQYANAYATTVENYLNSM